MNKIQHPKEILSPACIKDIRDKTFINEADRKLDPSVIKMIHQNRWMQILVPEKSGGQECPLPKAVALFEALTWADANVGWCVNLGAGANMFAGYLPEKVSSALFNSPQTWCAGSGAISGNAIKTKQGYLLTGCWKYASGSVHATHFTANAWLQDADHQPLIENGEPAFLSFIFPAEKVKIQDTWQASGLKATSSNEFEVTDLLVSEDHTFSLTKPSSFATGPLYRFPFGAMAYVNIACMPNGIALHFIDLFQELMEEKKPLYLDEKLNENEWVKKKFQQVTQAFYEARSEMYTSLDEVWQQYEAGQQADDLLLKKLIKASKNSSAKALYLVQSLFQVCGMNIVYSQSALNKVWRDMAVASQHYLLSPIPH